MLDPAKLLLSLVTVLILSGPAPAQPPVEGDPFAAGGGDPFAAPGDASTAASDMAGDASAAAAAAGAASGPVGEDDPNPLVRMLLVNPPKSPAEFAETLEWMIRIGRWDEVSRYISLLQKNNWNQNQLAELSIAGGADLWFKLRDTKSDLTDAQREFIRMVAGLPAKLSRDPQWLDGWILRLAAKTPAERREAQLRLMRGGRAAIERLCVHLMAGHPRVSGGLLANALVDFQPEGVEALRAACMTPDVAARGRVFLAVAQSSASDFGAEMGAALQDEALPQTTRQAISEALLKKYGKLPTPESVRDYIAGKFKTQLDQYQLMRTRPARVPGIVWRVSADGKSVKAMEAPVPDHALETLSQLATHRLSCSGTTELDLVDCATVLAQRAYQANRPLVGWLAQPKETSFWKHVLERSHAWQMHGASLIAAETIGRTLPSSAPSDASYGVMAECLRDSRPGMRYVAAAAIAKADVQHAYNGSAAALETAVEMGRLGQGPTVLVIGLSSDLRLAAKQQLLAMGAEAIEVTSTADALRVLNEPYPIEYIMVVDRLPRNSILTSVDRLRHSKRGASLPIAVLTDEMDGLEKSELSKIPGVVFSVLSEVPDQMQRVISELERRLDTRPLSSAQRQAYTEAANQFLATIAKDRQSYGYYELPRWEKELAEVANNFPSETRLTLLGGLGTAASQQELVSLAANGSMDVQTRQQAAELFASSIGSHGLLLGRAGVIQAYNDYNSQGPTDPVTVSALGKVLDAIESRKKK